MAARILERRDLADHRLSATNGNIGPRQLQRAYFGVEVVDVEGGGHALEPALDELARRAHVLFDFFRRPLRLDVMCGDDDAAAVVLHHALLVTIGQLAARSAFHSAKPESVVIEALRGARVEDEEKKVDQFAPVEPALHELGVELVPALDRARRDTESIDGAVRVDSRATTHDGANAIAARPGHRLGRRLVEAQPVSVGIVKVGDAAGLIPIDRVELDAALAQRVAHLPDVLDEEHDVGGTVVPRGQLNAVPRIVGDTVQGKDDVAGVELHTTLVLLDDTQTELRLVELARPREIAHVDEEIYHPRIRQHWILLSRD